MNWKRLLLIGAGWGIGMAVGLAAIGGVFIWYEARPKPPKPPKSWDTTSIKAEYDKMSVEGPNNDLVFTYTLENTTDFDYRVEDAHHITMSARLHDQNNLSPFGDHGRIDYPIFVPAKKRMRFDIHINYPYPAKEKSDASSDERSKFQDAVESYVSKEFSNLDGFDLLDETNRYEVVFPSSWKKPEKH
jgi:hypothetical protein